MKKTLLIISLLFILTFLTACEKKLEQKDIDKYLVISNEKKGISNIIQNNKHTYIVEFNLKNNSNYDLYIVGNIQISLGDTKIKERFYESIDANKEIVVKVFISSPLSYNNFNIDYINIFEAKYK